MAYLQTLVNGIVLGALYACLAVGFSLVWGVLNIINMLHGSLIILGGYLTFFAWHSYGIHPLLALPAVALLLFALGYALQLLVINRVVNEPVLTTLTLTFGLDLILYNFMTVYYTATPRARDARPRRRRSRRHRHAGRSAARHGCSRCC